jgi:hypothetical protein
MANGLGMTITFSDNCMLTNAIVRSRARAARHGQCGKGTATATGCAGPPTPAVATASHTGDCLSIATRNLGRGWLKKGVAVACHSSERMDNRP